MTQVFREDGTVVPVTRVQAGPCFVTQVKSNTDGVSAIQIGFGSKMSVKKPQAGLFKKLGVEQNLRWLREVRIKEDSRAPIGVDDLKLGQEVKVGEVFKTGDAVKVTATSKGKGFQGGVRRHGFAGGPKTHGQSDRHRAPGSIGQGTTPGRVYKGKKMAGHMGMETVSYTGLEVINVDQENNLITIKGGVPGPRGGLVRVEKQGQIKGYTPPPEEKEEEEVPEVTQNNSEDQSVSEPEAKEGEKENAS